MKAIRHFCMVAFASISFCACNQSGTNQEPLMDKSEIILENIMTRSSVRSFTDQPISEETIEKILRAGMAAPTAVNSQPWAFVVVTDRAQLDSLKSVHPYAQMLGMAQAAIVVCGDMDKAIPGDMKDYWIQDASAATENILLAAHGLGLGAVWTGVYPNPAILPHVKRILNLPSTIIPLNIIPMGYPAGEQQPKDKWKPENIHYQKW